MCKKGLHDLDTEGIVRRWAGGRTDRICGPCWRSYAREHARRKRREAGVPERPQSTPEQRQAERRRFLELVAEGRSISAASLAVGRSTTWGTRIAAAAGVRSRFASGEQEGRS